MSTERSLEVARSVSDKDTRALLIAAARQGFILIRGGHNVLIKDKDRRVVARCSSSAMSDHRGRKNLLASLRSAGFKEDAPKPKKERSSNGWSAAIPPEALYDFWKEKDHPLDRLEQELRAAGAARVPEELHPSAYDSLGRLILIDEDGDEWIAVPRPYMSTGEQ